MRRLVLALLLTVVVLFAIAGPAMASEPRCCVNKHPGGPPTAGGGLPFTGLPLYIPVLLSLGAIGTGVVLRRRTREQL